MVRYFRSILSSIFIGLGYLHASPWLWFLGIYSYDRFASFQIRALIQVWLLGYFYLLIYQQALILVQPNWHQVYLLLTVLLFFAVWCIWFYMMDRLYTDKARLFLWLVLSENIWQWCGIGLYRSTPMLVSMPFDRLVYFTGGLSLYIFFAMGCYRWLGVGLIFLLSCLSYQLPSVALQLPTVLAEGVDYLGEENTIYHNLEEPTYSRYVGYSFQGVVSKRHPVGFVEPYLSGRGERLLCDQACYLVLICYDVLFDDWLEEYSSASAIIAVSNLALFAQSPFYHYFQNQLAYIHIRSKKPVIYRDTLKSIDWGTLD
ncbi:hypothetical protein OAT84_00765 [Gammaproteobacteria bacterium]|nr:hypothetical protein [Gammaproteobacteria bacterium]